MKIIDKIKSFFSKKKKKSNVFIGDSYTVCTIAKSIYGIDQKVGLNFSTFCLCTKEDIFKVNDRIESEIGIMCKVIKTFKITQYYYSDVILETNNPVHYCPPTELREGKQWKLRIRFSSEM